MVFETETGRIMSNSSTESAKPLRTSLLIATICLIASACWVFASGDNLPGKPKLADKPASDENSMDFAVIYAKNCAACHGADGKLGPAPPLNDPLFRAIVPRDILTQVVSEGRAGTPMPAFSRAHGGNLARPQIQVLVDQIKGEADGNGGAAIWGSVEPAFQRTALSRRRASSRANERRFRNDPHDPLCPSLRRLSRPTWRRNKKHRRHQQSRLPRACERSIAAAHHHHRPTRSWDAEFQILGTPFVGFQAANLGGNRRFSRSAWPVAAGQIVPREIGCSAWREKTGKARRLNAIAKTKT